MSSARDWRVLLFFVAPFLLLYAIILNLPVDSRMWLSLNQVDLFGPGIFRPVREITCADARSIFGPQ